MKLIMLLIVVIVVAVTVRFVWICLIDLARAPDEQLQLFPRTAWAILIVATVPLGAILYLLYGKGPRRPLAP